MILLSTGVDLKQSNKSLVKTKQKNRGTIGEIFLQQTKFAIVLMQFIVAAAITK